MLANIDRRILAISASEMDDRQIVAVAIAIFREERVLLLRRSAMKDAGAGIWETVSGRVASGEEPLDAAAREVKEETGLDCVIHPTPVDCYAARRGEAPMIVIVYRADWLAGEARLSEEHDRFAWATPDEIARSAPPRLATAIARAQNVK